MRTGCQRRVGERERKRKKKMKRNFFPSSSSSYGWVLLIM